MLELIKGRTEKMKALTNRKGQSMVELTLITPLLLVALYIPADFGIGLFIGHLTQNAVREAARIGVANKDPFDSTAAGDVADDALSRLPALLKSPTVAVNYYSGSGNCMVNVEVRAQGSYNFFLYQLIRMLGFTVPDSITINRATSMRYEFQPELNGGNSSGTNLCTTSTVTATRP